jgi:hypothetical protein
MALNGNNTFRFLDLPLEIREIIYYEYFSLVVPYHLTSGGVPASVRTVFGFPPSPKEELRYTDCGGSENLWPITYRDGDDYGLSTLWPTNYTPSPLCAVSRQLSIDSAATFIQHFCRLHVSTSGQATDLLKCVDRHPSVNPTHIRTVQLYSWDLVTCAEYVKFLQRCDQIRDLCIIINVDKDHEELASWEWLPDHAPEWAPGGVEPPEGTVEEFLSAFKLTEILKLPRLERLWLAGKSEVTGCFRPFDLGPWQWLLEMWFSTQYKETELIIYVAPASYLS